MAKKMTKKVVKKTSFAAKQSKKKAPRRDVVQNALDIERKSTGT